MSVCATVVALIFSGCGRAELTNGNDYGGLGPIDGSAAGCGDRICEPSETPLSCADDCSCGDAVCSIGEICPSDCAAGCGDGRCVRQP